VDAIRGAPTVDAAIERIVALPQQIGVDHVHCRLEVQTAADTLRFEANGPVVEAARPPKPYRLQRSLAWAVGDTQLSGSLTFEWFCPQEQLHLPEAGSYDWIALVLRDRVLELVADDTARALGPELAHQLRS